MDEDRLATLTDDAADVELIRQRQDEIGASAWLGYPLVVPAVVWLGSQKAGGQFRLGGGFAACAAGRPARVSGGDAHRPVDVVQLGLVVVYDGPVPRVPELARPVGEG